jgi:hypothetical protein
MAYTLKIVNHIANPIIVGFFGHTDDTTFRVKVDAGATWDSPPDITFTGGHRMAVVWDGLVGHPIVVSNAINMQGNTGLNITPHSVDAFTPI